MAKRSSGEAVEVHDDPELFPELEKDNAKHKQLAKALKDFESDRSEHAEAIATLHENMVESEQKALNLMHECKLPKVRVNGKVYIATTKGEKIKVKKVKKVKAPEPADTEADDD